MAAILHKMSNFVACLKKERFFGTLAGSAEQLRFWPQSTASLHCTAFQCICGPVEERVWFCAMTNNLFLKQHSVKGATLNLHLSDTNHHTLMSWHHADQSLQCNVPSFQSWPPFWQYMYIVFVKEDKALTLYLWQIYRCAG